MSVRDLLKKDEDLISKQVNESFKNKDNNGKYAFYLQETGIPLWRYKEGDHVVDIIPWVTGKQYPGKKEGELVYKLDLFVHSGVGPNEDRVVCPARNFKKPCPICEAAVKLDSRSDDEATKNLYRKLSPTRRCLYVVLVYDSVKDEEAGLQLFDISHFYFEKNVLSLARDRRTGKKIPFPHPDKGSTIEFTVEGKGLAQRLTGFKLIPRDYVIPDEIMDQIPSLDEFIDIKSYDEIKALFSLGASPDVKEETMPDTTDVKDEPVKTFRSVRDNKVAAKPPLKTAPVDDVEEEEEEVVTEELEEVDNVEEPSTDVEEPSPVEPPAKSPRKTVARVAKKKADEDVTKPTGVQTKMVKRPRPVNPDVDDESDDIPF